MGTYEVARWCALAEDAVLQQGAASLGVPLSATQCAQLRRLLDELATWSAAYNLTALDAHAEGLTYHLLDSLAAAPLLAGTRIADLGTGAGFPGLPLAVAEPARHFTLIDSTAKKIRFVTHAARTLGLGNVTALQARLETLPAPAPPFDTLIARALAPLPRLLPLLHRLCGPATRILAMTGRLPSAELAALPEGWRLIEQRPIHVPGLAAERHILTIAPH
jgi:16S rRNA (guanine527-N7)-methyltransferase